MAINPARGGTDKGHTAGNVYEKDITLEVGKALLQYLNEHNDGKYYFYLTRDADTAMTDGARVASATSHQADMMITLCCNGSEEELGGTIGVSYDRAAEWKAEWHNEDEKEPEWTDEETVRDKLSADLAEQLMDACADGFGMWSRFPEVQNTAVLNTDMISCTIYMGYLTYEYDLERVTEQVNQSKSAEAMGKVILEFLKTRCPLRTPEPKPVSVEDLVDGYDPSAYTQKDHSQDSDSSDDYDDEE